MPVVKVLTLAITIVCWSLDKVQSLPIISSVSTRSIQTLAPQNVGYCNKPIPFHHQHETKIYLSSPRESCDRQLPQNVVVAGARQLPTALHARWGTSRLFQTSLKEEGLTNLGQPSNEVSSSFKGKQIITAVWTFLRSFSPSFLLSILMGVGIGYMFGMNHQRSMIWRQAIEAATATAATTTTSLEGLSPRSSARRPSAFLLLLTAVLCRELWNALPQWIKRQIPPIDRIAIRYWTILRNMLTATGPSKMSSSISTPTLESSTASSSSSLIRTDGGHKHLSDLDQTEADDDVHRQDPTDMTSIASIASKLQGLFSKASEKLAEPLSTANAQVALLALLQLSAQVKKQSAHVRDQRYEQSNTSISSRSATNEIVSTVDNNNNNQNRHVQLLYGMDELFEFADWAYDEIPNDKPLKVALREVGFVLVRHDKIALPGQVAHYVAISKERKIALIGIKGTSNFEDLLTDCCGQAVSFNLTTPFVPGGITTDLRCHEGILLAATRLADDVDTLIEELLLPNQYKLVITGHSLGAGVAAVLGILLRSRFPQLQAESERTTFKDDNGHDDLPLRVVAFASPPVLDHDNALACASFCTTVVNNSDVVPRASLSNLVVLLEFLKAVSQRLEETGSAPKDLATVAGFLKLLSQGEEGPMIMTVDDLENELVAANERVELKDPDHLYVPGNVLLMYDLWSKEGYGEQPSVAPEPMPTLEADNQNTTVVSPLEGNMTMAHRTAERVHVTDGTTLPLRYIELDSRMMSDHLAPGYRSSIKSLLSLSPSSESLTR